MIERSEELSEYLFDSEIRWEHVQTKSMESLQGMNSCRSIEIYPWSMVVVLHELNELLDYFEAIQSLCIYFLGWFLIRLLSNSML